MALEPPRDAIAVIADSAPASGPEAAPARPPRERALATLAHDLHAVAFRLARALRRADSETGANGPELSALAVLARTAPCTLRALACAEHVTPPTMTRLVQRMARRGLVTREVDPRDRRTVRVAPTRRGRALLRAGDARRVAALQRRLHMLPPEDLAALARAFWVLDQVLR